MAALGVTVAARLGLAGANVWVATVLAEARADGWSTDLRARLHLADLLVVPLGNAGPVLLVVTAILYLYWLHGAVKLTRRLGKYALEWTPRQAVAGYLIPFMNLVQPYQVMRDLIACLDPARIAEPPPRVDVSRGGGYRDVAYVPVPAPKPVPRAMVGVWWATFWGATAIAIVARKVREGSDGLDTSITAWGLYAVASLVGATSAALAIQLVRSVVARLTERLRRISLSTPEELSAQGIMLDP